MGGEVSQVRALRRVVKGDATASDELSYFKAIGRIERLLARSNADVVILPLRSGLLLGRMIRLISSLKRESGKLPLFSYPPLSTHYFTCDTPLAPFDFDKQETYKEYFKHLKRILEKRGAAKPHIILIDDVKSGCVLTDRYIRLKLFLKEGFSEHKLTVIGLCDRRFVEFEGNADEHHSLNELVREGKAKFIKKGLTLLVQEGKVQVIAVDSLFADDKNEFLYPVVRSKKNFNLPAYNETSFKKDVFWSTQLLLEDIQALELMKEERSNRE